MPSSMIPPAGKAHCEPMGNTRPAAPYSALEGAATMGQRTRFAQLLGQGARASARVAYLALVNGHAEVFALALAHGGAEDGISPGWIVLAAGQARPTSLMAIADCGASLQVVYSQGCTPLHAAAGMARTENCLYLLRQGLDIEVEDHRGLRALHHAVKAGARATVHLLVALGASTRGVASSNPDIDLVLQSTPLEAAVRSNDPHLVILALEHQGGFQVGEYQQAIGLAENLGLQVIASLLRSELARREAQDALQLCTMHETTAVAHSRDLLLDGV